MTFYDNVICCIAAPLLAEKTKRAKLCLRKNNFWGGLVTICHSKIAIDKVESPCVISSMFPDRIIIYVYIYTYIMNVNITVLYICYCLLLFNCEFMGQGQPSSIYISFS